MKNCENCQHYQSCYRWCKKHLIEIKQDTKGFDYLINSGDYIIDFGYKTFEHCGIKLGKWCRNTVPFAEKEGIHIDFEKRGFYD